MCLPGFASCQADWICIGFSHHVSCQQLKEHQWAQIGCLLPFVGVAVHIKLKWLNNMFLIPSLNVLLWNSASVFGSLSSHWISSSTSWQEYKKFWFSSRMTKLCWLYLQALHISVNNDVLMTIFLVQLFSELVSHGIADLSSLVCLWTALPVWCSLLPATLTIPMYC